MSVESLAWLIEPVAGAGTLVAALVAASIVWRYRRIRHAGPLWRRRNWRVTQVCAVTSLFYLALAASCLILKDFWGWLYLMLAIQVGKWWLRRMLQYRPTPALRR